MIFIRQTSAAVVLVTLTLSLQCAGMAVVIARARPKFAHEVLRLGAIRSAILVMRLMTALLGLHLLEILLWAGFYRWLCFTSWLSASFLFAVVSRLVDREARASDTAITVAGDTTPGTRVRGGEAARRGKSTVSIS